MEISVIIPTYNRLELLKNQVDAVMNQTLPSNQYEVIVVNDGSSDGTKDYLDQVAAKHDHFIALHQQNGGPAKARNQALRQAKGSIIAFTDDDCEVANNWLEIIANELTDGLVGLQGLTYTDRANVTPLTHQIDNETGHNSVPTCNAAYRKELLLQIGGFDESFPYPHNEDADVSWRMQEIGEVPFCKEMKVYHPPRLDKFSKVAQRMKILESEFTLYHKNPQLYQKYRDKNPMQHIYLHVFFKIMWYNFYSKLKYWKRPQLVLQGWALTILWWVDLVKKYPRFSMM